MPGDMSAPLKTDRTSTGNGTVLSTVLHVGGGLGSEAGLQETAGWPRGLERTCHYDRV